MWVSQLERRKAPGDLRGILLVRLLSATLPVLRQETPWHRLTCRLDCWAGNFGSGDHPESLCSPSLATQCVHADFGRPRV